MEIADCSKDLHSYKPNLDQLLIKNMDTAKFDSALVSKLDQRNFGVYGGDWSNISHGLKKLEEKTFERNHSNRVRLIEKIKFLDKSDYEYKAKISKIESLNDKLRKIDKSNNEDPEKKLVLLESILDLQEIVIARKQSKILNYESEITYRCNTEGIFFMIKKTKRQRKWCLGPELYTGKRKD